MEIRQGMVTRFEYVAANPGVRAAVQHALIELDPVWHWTWSRVEEARYLLSVVIDAELGDQVRSVLTTVSNGFGEEFAAA